MEYRFSNNLNLETPKLEAALRFYTRIMGLRVIEKGEDWVKLDAGQNNLYITRGSTLGPVTEFIVSDLEKAREELLEHGCKVVRWEGRGQPCYIRDPFGFVFNLWEEPENAG